MLAIRSRRLTWGTRIVNPKTGDVSREYDDEVVPDLLWSEIAEIAQEIEKEHEDYRLYDYELEERTTKEDGNTVWFDVILTAIFMKK